MEQNSIVNILWKVNENSNLDSTNIVQEIKKAFTSAIQNKEKINKTERKAIEAAYQNWEEGNFEIDYFFEFNVYLFGDSRASTLKQTFLHFAARCAYQNVVNALIQAGANVNAQKVNVSNIFAKDVDYESKFKEITDTLMRKKVTSYKYNHNKETSLYFHSEEDYQNAVKALKDEKLDIVGVCSIYRGDTSLHFAAKEGNVDVVNALIQAGAKVNALGGLCKNTPLHLAAENGHIEVVDALIQAGAKVDALDGWDKDTPLHLATKNGYTAIVCLLLKKEATVDAQNSDRKAPLHLAAENGNVDIVCALIEAGAKVDTLGGRYKSTPLHFAAENGHIRVVELLLKRGADVVNAQNACRETPLHFAALRGNTNIIQSLIYGGADVSLKEARGLTPLDYKDVDSALLKKAEKKAQQPIKYAIILGIAGSITFGLSIGAMLRNDSAPLACAAIVSIGVFAVICGVILHTWLESSAEKNPITAGTNEGKNGNPDTSMDETDTQQEGKRKTKGEEESIDKGAPIITLP